MCIDYFCQAIILQGNDRIVKDRWIGVLYIDVFNELSYFQEQVFEQRVLMDEEDIVSIGDITQRLYQIRDCIVSQELGFQSWKMSYKQKHPKISRIYKLRIRKAQTQFEHQKQKASSYKDLFDKAQTQIQKQNQRFKVLCQTMQAKLSQLQVLKIKMKVNNKKLKVVQQLQQQNGILKLQLSEKDKFIKSILKSLYEQKKRSCKYYRSLKVSKVEASEGTEREKCDKVQNKKNNIKICYLSQKENQPQHILI